VSGGLAAEISGGDFIKGFTTGIIVSAFNHAAHNSFQKQDPLKAHLNEAGTLDEWQKIYSGKTREQIINELEARGKANSQTGGPAKRYIIDPKTGNVIDMRHFLIIGSKGSLIGNGVEEFQYLKGYPSGRDPQDYYSNSLGYKF
jgi:hypothetical protein